MAPITVSLIIFGWLFLSALVGLLLHAILPEHHLSDSTKDVVKLGTGTIATLSALVLGLLIASAKASFDRVSTELIQTGAKISLLDHTLARYGPEATEARTVLRRALSTAITRTWPEDKRIRVSYGPPATIEDVEDRLQELSPRSDLQRSLHARAEQIVGEMAEARWLLVEQRGESTVALPFLVILVFWLTIIFLSFGLFSRINATVVTVLLACALSAAGSIFLIIEMDRPTEGLMKVSDAPLRKAFDSLGKQPLASGIPGTLTSGNRRPENGRHRKLGGPT
jgi:hypothetical protein